VSLFRPVLTVGSFTLASRVLGFARDVLIAAGLGAGPVADAFFIAFKLPNFFRRLFAEGAFSAGFVPLFSRLLQREGRPAALAFAEAALSVLLPVLLGFVTLFQIAAPWLMFVLAPGFADDPAKFELTVTLTRIAFPYLLFISLVSLLGGVLNALDRFAAVAATPILLNLMLILAVTVLAHFTPTPGHALAWGVSLAGMAQFLFLVLACRRAGVALRLGWPRLGPRVRELLRLILPAALGAGVVQINLVVDVVLASFLPEGSVSYLFYADRLNQLPIGVVGVAVGTALLPTLSRLVAAGDAAGARHQLNRALEICVLLAAPATVAYLAIAPELVGALFQRGAFGERQAAATALALQAYAVGLPAYLLTKALTPPYFAQADTRAPVIAGLWAMAANLVLNLILMQFLLHAGLALGTALSAWLNVAILALGLRRRGLLAADPRLKRTLGGTLVASLAMGAACLLLARQLADPLAGSEPVRWAALGALVAAGLLLFLGLTQATGAVDWRRLRTELRRRR